MAVIAAAADFHSWADLIGVNVINTKGLANIYKEFLRIYSGLNNNNTYIRSSIELTGYQTTDLPSPIVVNASGKTEIAVTLDTCYLTKNDSTGDASGTLGDGRKFLKFINNAGQLVASLGFNSTSYAAGLAGVSNPNNTFRLFTYNSDGSVNSTIDSGWDMFKNVNIYNNNYPGAAINHNFTVHYKIDTVTPANSTLILYKDSCELCRLAGTQVHSNANMVLGSVKLRDNITNSGYAGYRSIVLASLLVSDTPMFGAQVFPLKPEAYTANNAFTGAITNINTLLQDTYFIASPNEVNTVAEFTIKRISGLVGSRGTNLKAGIHTLKYLSNYMYARYVQEGGVSVTFETKNKAGTTDVNTAVTSVVAANEDTTSYRTLKISGQAVDVDVSQIDNLVAEVKLVGV